MGGKILKLRSEELLGLEKLEGKPEGKPEAGLPDYMKPKLMQFKI